MQSNTTMATEPNSTDRMLQAVKRLAPVGTSALARHLQMTVEAARQQVNRLLEQGLIAGEMQPAKGAGRPGQAWRLTEAGQRHFPDAHAQLTVQLIDAVRAVFGEEGLERLIAAREAESRSRYAAACTGKKLSTRFEQLARVRSEEGYMARVEKNGGELIFLEDHCPICAAADSCRGFCRSEEALFQEIAGDQARVVRGEYLLEGGNRCAYRVIPITAL